MMATGLNKIETVTFFSNMALMDMNAKILTKLGKKGIVEEEDLVEFNKATWKHILDNLWHPGSQMKNPDKGVDKGVTVL
eukprot:15355876-Ditylum_brightwellii.AAC.1